MYKQIPPDKIEKAKELLSQGYSIRSAAQSTGMSFISARKIYNGLPVGVKWAKKKKVNVEDEYFNVNKMCWLTGWDLELRLNRVR